ncbi:RagB/SusD family nutrient uptake outer membrane protein [uncultured Roseivirga sp.]|uniref:RagB/SusD family nutrient uptake outer membrane protein n=1 Tax=uncultured Roseivirga sp. TaxID=543088 RepID=UPI0030D84244|tara:strand:- start:15414 stop:16982 length:1569 start_codon:yes stop_codon:yes gene_type:complete
MKKTAILLSSFLILLICSCDKFLEENPKNQISVDQYFNEPDDVRSVVNSLYGIGALQRYISGDFQINAMLGGYLSGFFENERTERPGPFEANNLTLNPNNMDEYLFNYWRDAYDAIAKANTAIKYIPDVPGLSTEEANLLLAEARFFRAFNYFALVRDFGDVPLVTEPSENLDNIYVARTSSDLVYDFIIEDLEWAIDNGGLSDLPFHSNGYRITEGAVAVTLANVQLQKAGYPLQGGTESYARAAEAAKLIITSGNYSLIPNGNTAEESAFNVMRNSETENEFVFSIEADEQYRRTSYYQLTLPKYAAVPDVIPGDVWIVYRPLDEYLRVYDPSLDIRIQNRQIWHNSIERNGEVYDFDGNWAPYTWYDEVALFETGRGGKNININLYSEVLLIAAEGIAQSEGVTSEAVGYLADVRSRGYWQTDRNQIESELAALTKEQFVEEVWKERLRELPLIFKTWSDIQRTRLYPITSETNPGEVSFTNVVGSVNPYGATFQEKHLLLPIATRVKDRNPEITGNGY